MEHCYGRQEISERHRHRYEFNNEYRDALTGAGLTLSGLSPDDRLVEAVELSDQPVLMWAFSIIRSSNPGPITPILCSRASFRPHLSIEMRCGMWYAECNIRLRRILWLHK